MDLIERLMLIKEEYLIELMPTEDGSIEESFISGKIKATDDIIYMLKEGAK